ncbi:MAG TPA: hypothetical protein VJH88_01435 [Candidatus Nanoarchaeia archaeon]|nr:hypothetical protein [Candidatus Nanoarchaeia archaeon]
MANDAGFRGVITFLDKLGVYDVVLPFLLVFTIIFAILEKTRILGVDEVDGKQWPKKNLNAVVAFVIAFLVIASTTLVQVINQTLAHVVLLVILIISFLMLVGIFWGTKEATLADHPNWMKFFMVIIFIGIVAILLNALGWLETIFGIILLTPDTDWAATAVLLVLVIAFIYYVTQDRMDGHEKHEKSDKH